MRPSPNLADSRPTIILDVIISECERETLLEVLNRRLDEIHAERDRVLSVIRATEAAGRK